ncbi:MAG: ribosomal protein L13e [Sulfolobales archaeon]
MKVVPYVKPPILVKNRGVSRNLRHGRGFSLCELEKAGLDVEKARSMGVPVDTRRKSCHEWNIRILQELLAKSR